MASVLFYHGSDKKMLMRTGCFLSITAHNTVGKRGPTHSRGNLLMG